MSFLPTWDSINALERQRKWAHFPGRHLVLSALFLVFLGIGSQSSATPAAEVLFKDNCASCHTIGEGESVGPDLKGVTEKRPREWLIRIILDFNELLEHKDPVALKLYKEANENPMPSFPELTKEQIQDLIDYLAAKSREGGETASVASTPAISLSSSSTLTVVPFAEPVVASPTELNPQDVVTGMNLFLGRSTLTNDLPACIACHALKTTPFPGGGSLGPDLSLVFKKLGKQKGLTAWLSTPPTPVMSALFRKTPLKKEDVTALVAVFQDSAKAGEVSESVILKLVASGLAGALVILVFFSLYWKDRLTVVRQSLMDERKR